MSDLDRDTKHEYEYGVGAPARFWLCSRAYTYAASRREVKTKQKRDYHMENKNNDGWQEHSVSINIQFV